MPILTAEPQCFPENLLSGLLEGASQALDEGMPDEPLQAEQRLQIANSGCGETPFKIGESDSTDPDAEQLRRWWVVHTKPRQEKSLARDLLTRAVPYYLPQVRKTSVVRGRKQTSYVPLFPSYVFLFGTEMERHVSMTTNRIAHLIPVASPLELTRQLFSLSRLVAAGAPLTVESRLKAGDLVRVKSGALAGVEGTVVARRRKCRLIVAVSLIQQGVSVEIDDHLLEPI